MEYVTSSILSKTFPKKDLWAHKGHYGRLLVIAGSEMMTGSPILVGKAALRAGADLVFMTGPKRAMEVAAHTSPTFITKPLNCSYLDRSFIRDIVDFAQEMRVTGLAIGPGLWKSRDTREAIMQLIEIFDIPMVVDADAIRASSDLHKKKLEGKNIVFTPHADEFRELTGETVVNEVNFRAQVVAREAKAINHVILLKGHADIISDGKRTAVNKTGNVYMTKGGFGDTLTGICAALMSRQKNQVDSFTAACAAAYINGRAGDIATKSFRSGILPTDLIDAIPRVISRG